jgi:flagellar biogenesis protein FliO
MRFTKIIFLALVLSMPSLAFPLVRLRSVSQSGQGKQGAIKVEFNGNYNFKKAQLNILEDRAEVTIPESFVIPVRRVYKPSSNTSSVIKMEVNQIPGNSVRVSVFFRIPTSNIKSSAKLSGTSNSVILNYTVAATASESSEQVASNEAVSLKSSDTGAEAKKEEASSVTAAVTAGPEKKTETKNNEQPGSSFLDEKKDGKKEASGGLGMAIARMIGALFVVLGLFFAAVFLFKRYLSGGLSFGLKNKKPETPIKMISTFAIAPGKSLYLVDVMGETLLLSSGKEGLHLVAKINAGAGNGSFNDITDEDLNKEVDTDTVDIPKPFATSDIKTKLKERLRSIKGA